MRRHEDAIAAAVNVVLASSTYLAEKFARRGLRVEKILNGCDGNDECEGRDDGCDRSADVPPSSAARRRSPPILGYLGCLGHWFDWRLIARLARAVPHAAIELVGPCPVAPPKRLPPNVRLLPACSHADSLKHLRRFSAGLIPFQRSALTAGVDPNKFYAYRAAGLPVLSTSFGEMALRGRAEGVYFLDAADDLAGVVSQALGDRLDAVQRRRFREEHDWSRRFRQSPGLRLLWGVRQSERGGSPENRTSVRPLRDARPGSPRQAPCGVSHEHGCILMSWALMTLVLTFAASLALTAAVPPPP